MTSFCTIQRSNDVSRSKTSYQFGRWKQVLTLNHAGRRHFVFRKYNLVLFASFSIKSCITKALLFRMSILEYNGGAIIAMRGKGCVAIAADKRLGIQAQTISCDFQKIFQMGPKLFVGLPGLATDVQTVANRLKFRLNLYALRENRDIKPETFMNMVSNLLYERRFGPYFVEPIVAGLHPKTNEPFVASMDLIGCPMIAEDFAVSGTCSEQMYGMCELLWQPDLEPDDLFETISQALMNAVDRDAVSGWGVVVHIIEKDKITTKTPKTRMD